ncbi:hypothetical protein M5K25_007848 [Dendrobium thyrsiflorum]|uniref:Uncharacterized protein n=1 Tax=Dendrobium thyrsiflorum TaxID=117978 RepID=A0ABD0VFF1_DENTH
MANRRSNRHQGASRSNSHMSRNQSLNQGRQASASFHPGGQNPAGEGTSGPSMEDRIRKMEESQKEILHLLRGARQPILVEQEEVHLPQAPSLARGVQPEHVQADIHMPQSRGRLKTQQDVDLVDTASSTHPFRPSQLVRIPSDIPEDVAQPLITDLPLELNVSEIQTQRHQIQLNPSPNESKSRTRSTGRTFKPQFGLPNGLQTGQSYSLIERLDETNPTSPRTQNSDTSKSENYPADCPYGFLGGEEIEETSKISRAPTPPPANSRGLPPTIVGLPPSHQPMTQQFGAVCGNVIPNLGANLFQSRRSFMSMSWHQQFLYRLYGNRMQTGGQFCSNLEGYSCQHPDIDYCCINFMESDMDWGATLTSVMVNIIEQGSDRQPRIGPTSLVDSLDLFHTGTNLEAKSSWKLHKLNQGPSKLRFQQTYSRTERVHFQCNKITQQVQLLLFPVYSSIFFSAVRVLAFLMVSEREFSLVLVTQGKRRRREEKKKKRREEGKEGRNSSSTTAEFSNDAGILSEFQITPEFCPTSKRGQNSARLLSDDRIQSNSQVTPELYNLCVTGYQSEVNSCNLIVLNFKDKSVSCISSKH